MAIRQPEVKYKTAFINGEFVPAINQGTYDLINPFNEESICQISKCEEIDVDRAVQAAKQAFDLGSIWRTMDASYRGRLIYQIAELIERDKSYMASLETLHNGKPYLESVFDMECCIQCFRYYAGWADKIHGKSVPADGNAFVVIRKEPVGVVGLIAPWNYPLMMIAWKMAPALATGCTMVIKPAKQTPLTGLYLAQLCLEAGFPPGVVNVVPGTGDVVGVAIARHPEINKVAFTGSAATGKQIMEMAGNSNLKRVSMELGGKSPVVVFPDTNLEEVVKKCHRAVFDNTGQICSAASRTYVHESIYNEFVEKSTLLARERKLGDPFDETTDQGPQVSMEQFKKVIDLIESGKEEGAVLKCGGGRWGGRGYFVEPTVFADVDENMRIGSEEVFGPVQSIFKFSTLKEVIARCNRTNYGLAASIFTNNVDTALTFAQSVRVGILWVNTYDAFSPHTPWGGYKQSGIGRELGEEGLESYLETKTIIIKVSEKNS